MGHMKIKTPIFIELHKKKNTKTRTPQEGSPTKGKAIPVTGRGGP
jgi:hypothetical protein